MKITFTGFCGTGDDAMNITFTSFLPARAPRPAIPPPRWGGYVEPRTFHGLRDAESGVAPPAATTRRPVGANNGSSNFQSLPARGGAPSRLGGCGVSSRGMPRACFGRPVPRFPFPGLPARPLWRVPAPLFPVPCSRFPPFTSFRMVVPRGPDLLPHRPDVLQVYGLNRTAAKHRRQRNIGLGAPLVQSGLDASGNDVGQFADGVAHVARLERHGQGCLCRFSLETLQRSG